MRKMQFVNEYSFTLSIAKSEKILYNYIRMGFFHTDIFNLR